MNKLNQDSLYHIQDLNLAPLVCHIKHPFVAYFPYFGKKN
jgi:hypothetical protein